MHALHGWQGCVHKEWGLEMRHTLTLSWHASPVYMPCSAHGPAEGVALFDSDSKHLLQGYPGMR